MVDGECIQRGFRQDRASLIENAASKLCGLRPQTYEHPNDASALDALSHNAGLDKLIRKLNGWGFERILRVELTGSYLRVTPDNFSELHSLLVKACDILDMPEVPGLYIAGEP